MVQKEKIKALVTGCAGFIGSNLVDELLRRGYEVVGIDCLTECYPREIKEANMADALNHKNFEFVEENILSLEEFPDVDYVFHEAALAGVRDSWGKGFEMYSRNNVEATQKILEFYKTSNIKKFVFASSSSVYGVAKLPMREDSLLKPLSPYGATKLACENLCYLYWANYGIPTISLRYFNVYGPRQRRDTAIYKFVKAILNDGVVTVFGDGTQTRDFTFVGDVVEANMLAVNSEGGGKIFNVGGGNGISVNELIKKIEKAIGKRAKIKHTEKQKGDVKDTWADTSKISAKLNWKPKVEIERGLRRFVEWYAWGQND